MVLADRITATPATVATVATARPRTTEAQEPPGAQEVAERHVDAFAAAGASVAAEACTSNAPRASPLEGPECAGCDRLRMREEPQGPGSRRRFFWRCGAGHEILELRRFGGRILVAPTSCAEFKPWQQRTM